MGEGKVGVEGGERWSEVGGGTRRKRGGMVAGGWYDDV